MVPEYTYVVYISLQDEKGCLVYVDRKRRNMTDIKIFAIVGENTAPIDVPCVCWNTEPANSKKLL